jgi:signal transduction histidine kinase
MSVAQSGLDASPRRQPSQPQDWLVGGGKMGELIRSMDWAKTSLGPIESWPQSLRTTVSLCLASNFPIALAWGPKHVQIYNDSYWPICGEKHPDAMGQGFTECWAAPWPVIGEAFTRALAGEASFLENQRMFLDRNGYLEETFFTFSFSPIRDETGVAGLFHPVTETTVRMLSERRTRALRDLAARTGNALKPKDVCTLAAQTLSDYQTDLPFALFYLFEEMSEQARLVARTGLPDGSAAGPLLVPLAGLQDLTWPLGELARTGRAQHVNNLEARFGSFSCGEYPESQKAAIALPLTPPGCKRPVGALVTGVSSRLELNETYRAFYDLLAATVTTAVANARSDEEERMRAEALVEIDTLPSPSSHWLANAAEPKELSPHSSQANVTSTFTEATALGRYRSRILLVDDNADLRDHAHRLLAERYDVAAFPDGLTALKAAQEKSPDLVLTEIMMPGLDGFGLLRGLRATPKTRSIPVILLLARAGEESAVEGWNAEADDYLTKPFSAQELMARVRTHLDLAHARREWTKEIEQSNRELESFSYSISHDLRAPLRAIDGFSKALLDEYSGKLDEQGCHYLQRVRTGAQKMSMLINELLDLSRVSRGALRKELINLSELARGIVSDLQSRDPDRKVAVEIPDGLLATADKRLLKIVILNLLSNAWKYTARASYAQIAFGQSNHGDETVFYVRDNGVGFDMAFAGRLFAPFQRLHRKSEFDGTGIGLATAQRVISRHGGRIWGEAAVDTGATFYFTLGDIR